MSQEAILSQVGTMAADLANRLERLLGRELFVHGELVQVIRSRAAALDNPGTPEAADAARAVMGALFPDEDPPVEFWATATGGAVARAIGYHRAVCPYVQAAAILGVTRQRIYQLCEGGILQRTAGAVGGEVGVLPISLRDHLWRAGRRPARVGSS